MSKVSYQVLGGLTSTLSFISVAGAAYIIYGAIQIRRSIKDSPSKTRPLFVINHVLYMSICDVFQQGWIGFSWLPVAFDASFNADWSPGACKITGMFAQFFLVASASWNFVIAICLMRMLLATPIHVFEREIKYHHLFAWGVSFMLCIVPWFENAYGYVRNPENNYDLAEFECWIYSYYYQLCLYLPAMIYVFIAFMLLVFTFISHKKKKIRHASTSLRLAAYTIVFVVTWLFPIILRLHGMISDNPPTAIVWFHHISLASIGIGNAVIWGTSQSIKEAAPISRSKQSKTKSSVNFSTQDVTSTNTQMELPQVSTQISQFNSVTPEPKDRTGIVILTPTNGINETNANNEK